MREARDTLDGTTSIRGSWQTLKMLGAIVGFALMLGSAVVGIAIYIGSGPTRDEFEREREHSREVTDDIKGSITQVEKDQIRLRGSYDSMDERQKKMDEKIDVLLQQTSKARR
jgi:hypothetical protein